MGQKIHPIGFRIGVIRDWESKWYAEKDFPALLLEDYQIRKYCKKKLYAAGISHIEIERAANKVKVTLFTGKPGIIIGRGGKGVDDLRAELEKMTKKQVHVNVQEVRSPETDAQLVAESIAQQIEKRVAYKRAMKQSINRAMRMGALGMKVRCAGRLAGAEMARVENAKEGKIPLHTLRADIDYGFAEAATTYGNIGIKVWIYKGEILPGQRRGDKNAAEEAAFLARRRERPERRERGADNRGRGGGGGGRGYGGGGGGGGRGYGGGGGGGRGPGGPGGPGGAGGRGGRS